MRSNQKLSSYVENQLIDFSKDWFYFLFFICIMIYKNDFSFFESDFLFF